MIIGESVTLLPFDQKFAPLTLDWINKADVRDGTGTEGPVSDLEHQRWYERTVGDPTQRVFIIGEGVGRDAAAIGVIGLRNINMRYRSAQYWIYIGREECRGKRLAFQATVLLLGFGFNTLGLNRIWLQVKSTNSRAVRLYEQLGFVREGTGRQEIFIDGHFEDMLHYSILESEYRTRYSRPQSLT